MFLKLALGHRVLCFIWTGMTRGVRVDEARAGWSASGAFSFQAFMEEAQEGPRICCSLGCNRLQDVSILTP